MSEESTTDATELSKALLAAAKRGELDHIQRLSSHANPSAFVDIATIEGMTALHYAACGKPALIPVLLSMGARLEVRDNDGFTPLLHAASQDGSPECLRLLLDAGADVSVMCAMNKPALFYAQGNQEKSDMLTEGGKKLELLQAKTAASSGDNTSLSCVVC